MSKNLSWRELLNQINAIIRLAATGQRGLMSNSFALKPEFKNSMMELLGQYRSNQDDFEQFVRFSQTGYTKNMVSEITNREDDKNVLSNIIVMCWAPSQASAFHAHEGSKCFVKVLQGQVRERRVPHPSGTRSSPLNASSESLMPINSVAYIDDDIGCHQVTNESVEEPAITLHVYLPPYTRCRIFQPIDIDQPAGREEALTIERSRVVDVFQ